MTSADVNVNRSRNEQTASTSLLNRVRADENEAWRRLLDLYEPAVKYWCSHKGLAPEDILEVCQEVFVAARQGLRRFRREEKGQSFGGWLRTITIHKIIDRNRRTIPQAIGGSDAQRMFVSIAEEVSSSVMGLRDEQKILHERAIALIATEFSDRDNEAFIRVVVHGEEPSDVAAALNVSANVVYLAKSRILRRLREEFGELLEE